MTLLATPLTPAQEAERLRALQPYKGLAHTHNPIFKQVVQLTARLFALPISLLSLVDAEVVAYPGKVGMPELADELPRQESICAVAVLQPDHATVFPNLRAEPCPWVSPEAQASYDFYASYPVLTTAAHQPIGTLCVLDRQPHEFGPDQQLILGRMAGIAMRLLDLELAASPAEAPALWTAIEGRVQLSLQRIETLTALARWETSTETAAARAYQSSLHEERLFIVQDIEYQVNMALKQATGKSW